MNKTSDWIKVFLFCNTFNLLLLFTESIKTYFCILLISLIACFIGKLLFSIINYIDKRLS